MSEKKICAIMSIATHVLGFGLLLHASNWQITLAVFLLFMAHNMERHLSKKKTPLAVRAKGR